MTADVKAGTHSRTSTGVFSNKLVWRQTAALASRGHDVLLANSRGPQSLIETARRLGPTVTPVTVRDAALERLRTEGRPDAPPSQRLAIPIAGDDAAAKAVVSRLIDDIGFAAVDIGVLAAGRHQQPGQPIYNAPVSPAQARKLLQQL